MKKLNYILLAGLALIATACVSDEEELFDKSAAQRMNDLVESNTKLLESSEYGWVFNYYIGHDDATYGGLVHTARFVDGKVYLRSESVGDTSEAASLYQVKAEQECLLSFDTYNDYFHYWSGPLGSSAPDGYESDYEFTFKSISADQDTITLKGKKYGVYAQLIRLKEDGAEYMEKIFDMSEKVNKVPHNELVVNGKSYEINMDEGIFEYTVTESAPTDFNPDATETSYFTVPYITTTTGVHLYTPVTFGTETFQDITYNGTTTLTANDGKVQLNFIKPEDYVEYDQYLGEYTSESPSDGTLNITISADGTGKGYNITGFAYGTVYASYLAGSGKIEICSQRMNDYGSYQIWLCVSYGGYLSWTTSLGMIGTLHLDENGNTIISFKTNDASTPITTFIEYAFSGDASSSTALGWWTKFADPLVFTKK